MAGDDFPVWREKRPLQRWMLAVLGAPLTGRAPDPSRLILWAPVALGAGSAVYFSWPVEPAIWLGWAGAALAALCLVGGLWRLRGAGLLYAGVLGAALLTGFCLAQHRTHAVAPPPLPAFEVERTATVTGWIEAVERSGGRARLRIRVASLEHADAPPRRIRVRAGLGDFAPGDAVRFRARLSPPAAPVAAGGYDPARAAWFDQVALTGYAISPLEAAALPGVDRRARALSALRWRLAERIRLKAGPETGAVAAALLTGERAQVSSEDAEALRISGLGHILAISGLHMALFAGGVYAAARLALAAIEPWARAHDPRKPAAVIALLAATAYLVLSGAAVSTQRAYVMAAVVLVGVMADRRAFSMRSLALAALLVLILAPESVIEPGFQMSFAAVAALIAVYDVWSRARPAPQGANGWWRRGVAALSGLSATSLIAGAATGAFAAFHFQRVAAYGLIANLAAMPVFTFWVMPAGGVALALAPVGLDGPALWVMDQGLRVVLAIAHAAAGLDGSALGALAVDPGWVALYGAGFALAFIGLGAVRLAGLTGMAAALMLWALQAPPNMMITDAGVVIARFDDAEAFQASSTRRGRFDAQVFLQRLGEGGRPGRAGLQCDTLGCTGVTGEGVRLAVTALPEALAEDCERADIVVFEGEASAWRRRRCAAVLLDDAARAELGGAEFWLEDGAIVRVRGAQDSRRQRLWAGRSAL